MAAVEESTPRTLGTEAESPAVTWTAAGGPRCDRRPNRARGFLAGLFPIPRVSQRALPEANYLPRTLQSSGPRGCRCGGSAPVLRQAAGGDYRLWSGEPDPESLKDGRQPIGSPRSADTGGAGTPRTVTPRRQAAYLRKTYKRRRPTASGMTFAGVVGSRSRTCRQSLWFDPPGLFTARDQAKPSGRFVGSPAELLSKARGPRSRGSSAPPDIAGGSRPCPSRGRRCPGTRTRTSSSLRYTLT